MNFLKLQAAPEAEGLPFCDVLKIRGAYCNRQDALSHKEIKKVFLTIDRSTFLGIRDYAGYALMYLLGLRVGERIEWPLPNRHRRVLEVVSVSHPT